MRTIVEIEIPQPLSDRIRDQSEKECRSFKSQILKIITDGIYNPIVELAIDKGRFISMDDDNYELLEEIARRYKLPTPVEAIKKWIAEEQRHFL